MREVKLKIDQKFDVKTLLLEYLRANNISEFYERKIKADGKNLFIFAYESIYKKYTVHGMRGVYFDVTATITMIVSEKNDSTAVVFILPTDYPKDVLNSFDLKLKDNGFSYII